MEHKLAELLKQTKLLHDAAVRHVAELQPAVGLRPMLAFRCGVLALEHSRAVLHLVGSGHLSSGYAPMRPQFESLVRGIWLLHAANNRWIEKFAEPLTVASAKNANEGPGLADMLKELEASHEAPGHIVVQLREFKDVAWKPLNSYTHGSIHPLTRLSSGYPPQLTYDAVRNANAVLALTLQLLSILTGDPCNMTPVRHMHVEFSECFNVLPPNTSE